MGLRERFMTTEQELIEVSAFQTHLRKPWDQDLALSLPDGSVEQQIVMAIFDDRDCGGRACCRGKLGLSEAEYDAGLKRLLRKLPVFAKEWRDTNKIGPEDCKEAR